MRTRAVAIAGVVTAAVVGVAGPAEATTRWPSEAVLTNAAGETNGCRGTATITVDDEYANFPGELGFHPAFTFTCPRSANVHRQVLSIGYDIIQPDGTVETVAPLSQSSRGYTVDPVETGGGATWAPCSKPEFTGTHQWRYRVVIKTKTTADNSDPNPFIGRMQVKRRVTCPG